MSQLSAFNTGSIEWRVYNAHAPVPIEQKLFRTVRIDEDLDSAYSVLDSSVREHDRLDTSGGGVRDELDGPLRVGEVGPEILGLEEQARRSQQQERSAAFVFSSPNWV